MSDAEMDVAVSVGTLGDKVDNHALALAGLAVAAIMDHVSG